MISRLLEHNLLQNAGFHNDSSTFMKFPIEIIYLSNIVTSSSEGVGAAETIFGRMSHELYNV